jgi:hypothetical protein
MVVDLQSLYERKTMKIQNIHKYAHRF